MKKNPTKPFSSRSSIGMRLTLSIGLIITITSLFLFISIYKREEKQRLQQINTQAEALLSEMLVAREWVSSYNGIWTTSPGDHYLEEKNGYFQKSPAMVTKELSDLSENKGYYRFHITSLMLMNPENTPDDFEHDVLELFEIDPEPITAIDRTGDDPIYRLMIPLNVEASCLECHQDQGYETGDVRGGLSVLVPINEMDASLASSRRLLTFSGIGIISLVMAALYILVRRMVISPVGQLKEVAIAVGEGNYDARCNLNTGDELEVFGKTLNEMVANLQTSQNILENRVTQRTQELSTISEIALIISRAGALDDVLKEALDKVINTSDASAGIVHLFEEESARIAAHQGVSADIYKCFQIANENELSSSQEAIIVKDMVNASLCETLYPNRECIKEDGCQAAAKGYIRAASILLKSRSRSLGTMILLSKNEKSFSPETMQLLESIGNQLGVAIENAKFHQSVEAIAVLEERARISRELHDSLAQTLGWLSIKTEMLEEDLQFGKIEESNTEMKAIRRVVRDACYDVRESIDGLRTRPTGNLTTTAAAWISEFRQRSGLITDFHAMDGDMPLSPRVETELLRILQEALTNVRKHAKATHVQVDLQTKGKFAELKIKDDGSGFDYQSNQTSGHFGLRIMRERAEKLNGTFHISSSPENGTAVKVILPLYPTM